MRSRLAFIVVLSVTPISWAPIAAQEKSAPSKKKESRKAPVASLTGCVDQQDGRYILIHEQTRSTIANLEAEGFETEGFAKHVGHKVTVRGTGSPDGAGSPTFRVRSVETLSETCGPHEHHR